MALQQSEIDAYKEACSGYMHFHALNRQHLQIHYDSMFNAPVSALSRGDLISIYSDKFPTTLYNYPAELKEVRYGIRYGYCQLFLHIPVLKISGVQLHDCSNTVKVFNGGNDIEGRIDKALKEDEQYTYYDIFKGVYLSPTEEKTGKIRISTFKACYREAIATLIVDKCKEIQLEPTMGMEFLELNYARLMWHDVMSCISRNMLRDAKSKFGKTEQVNDKQV